MLVWFPNEFKPTGVMLTCFTEGLIQEINFFLGIAIRVVEPEPLFVSTVNSFHTEESPVVYLMKNMNDSGKKVNR